MTETRKLHRETRQLLFDLQNLCVGEGTNEEVLEALKERMEDVIPTTGGLRAIKALLDEGADQNSVRSWALAHRIHECPDPVGLEGKAKYVYMIATYMSQTHAGSAMDRKMRRLHRRPDVAESAEKARRLWVETPMRMQ